MKNIEFPKFVRIVDVSYLDFDSRDLIYVKEFKDFLFLCGDDDREISLIVYCKRNSYYLLSKDCVWVYEYKDVRE